MRRHAYNLSHYRLTSFNMGELVPIACIEVLPGDSFRHRVEALMRVSPLVTPVMHPVNLVVQTFFCPFRLLWTGFEDFITQKSATPPPTFSIASAAAGSLADHLGFFNSTATPLVVNALPFIMYSKLWNTFYRDQDLQTALNENVLQPLQNVCWEKDVYTTARPTPQKGLEGRMSLRGLWAGPAVVNTGYTAVAPNTAAPGANVRNLAVNQTGIESPFITAEDFRVAMSTQKIREARNKYGSRYVDYLRFLGIRPSDARLDRPELLASDRVTISFSEVLQTAPVAAPATFVGDMAGHGIATLRSRAYRRFFEEHGLLMSVAFARPKSIYMQQMSRFNAKTLYSDFWQKEDEMLGDQALDAREINSNTTSAATTFGYVDRHYDYRRIPSSVVSSFRVAPDNQWHLARDFGAALPVLNSAFVSCTPPNRPFADTAEKQLRLMVAHNIQSRRLVSPARV